jgi:protein-L-isoaspartate(D-aspartate) O-methyltransferase
MALHKLILLLGLLIITPGSKWIQDENYTEQRYNMVKTQIANRGINHSATLKAMRMVSRHDFVPSNYKHLAYRDGPIPIGHGQTISQPYIVAFMTHVIQPKAHFKVLEIGTGSGYQAAVLAVIVDSVFTIEIIPELGKQASSRLQKLGYKNVYSKIADGYFGWKEHAPYDAIIVTAAATYIPPPLISQLKVGGYMVIPVGHPFQVQQLMLIRKKEDKISSKTLFPVRFVPFTRNQ